MRVKVSLKVTTYVSPLLFLNTAWTLDNVKVFLVIFLVDSPQRKKETQICHRFVQTIGLLLWLSVCVLTIWYFRPFGNAGLQSPRDPPSP